MWSEFTRGVYRLQQHIARIKGNANYYSVLKMMTRNIRPQWKKENQKKKKTIMRFKLHFIRKKMMIWTSCATHTLNLMLEGIGKTKLFIS